MKAPGNNRAAGAKRKNKYSKKKHYLTPAVFCFI
jgi:hypothetical protein